MSTVDRHDVLLAIDLIGHRCRLAARRKPILPQESLVAPKLAKRSDGIPGTKQTSKLTADTSAFGGKADSRLEAVSSTLPANSPPRLLFIEKRLERHSQSFGHVPQRHDGRIALT